MARASDSPSGGTCASPFPARSISFCQVRRSHLSLNTLLYCKPVGVDNVRGR